MALVDRHQEGRNTIDQELCIKLINSMLEHIQKCLKAKGGHYLSLLL